MNIKSLGPGDDLSALSDLSRRAFGPIAAASRPGWEADTGAAIRDGRYLAADGFLAYRWHRGNDEILVERALAGSAATTRAMWAIVASHSTIAGTVRAQLGLADPVSLLTQEPDVQLAGRSWWMLRVVDAAAAVAGRGFPPAAEATLPLRLVDPACPGNDGRWTLHVADGKGVLAREAPAGAGQPAEPLALGPRGFAALYAGTAPATMRRPG